MVKKKGFTQQKSNAKMLEELQNLLNLTFTIGYFTHIKSHKVSGLKISTLIALGLVEYYNNNRKKYKWVGLAPTLDMVLQIKKYNFDSSSSKVESSKEDSQLFENSSPEEKLLIFEKEILNNENKINTDIINMSPRSKIKYDIDIDTKNTINFAVYMLTNLNCNTDTIISAISKLRNNKTNKIDLLFELAEEYNIPKEKYKSFFKECDKLI
jgi:hypothetical protein